MSLARWIAMAFVACLALAPAAGEAQTRRAFLAGVDRYVDKEIQPLTRAVNDAKDLGEDLQQLGFDKKNITISQNAPDKAKFKVEFEKFLNTIEEGDIVFFFFAGHGFGLEKEQENYLLFANLRSPFTFTSRVDELPPQERRNPAIVRTKIPNYIHEYYEQEIPRAGITVSEIANRLSERRPSIAVMALDACRSLVALDDDKTRQTRRGPETGSRLMRLARIPDGFLVLHSASFGEQAVESFGSWDRRRNGLFTEMLRAEIQRPGQTLIGLADRVRLVTRAVASAEGRQQEPEYDERLGWRRDFMLIEPIGASRLRTVSDRCADAAHDWSDVLRRPRREQVERHIRRFDGCATAEQARLALANAVLEDDEIIRQPPARAIRAVNDCDRLAASDHDRTRPSETPGVPFAAIDTDAAERACRAAVEQNPRIARFKYNLGRSLHRAASRLASDDPQRLDLLKDAERNYQEAERAGHLLAIHNLGALYSRGGGLARADDEEANRLFRRAAQQGLPIAMHVLGLRYIEGSNSIARDWVQANEWFARAAEAGYVPSMVQRGISLNSRIRPANPRASTDWLQRAAEAGSNQARVELGNLYYAGPRTSAVASAERSNLVVADHQIALLWYARAAEAGNSVASYYMALMTERGEGLPAPQPEMAERYWRLAAHGGYVDAQVDFAERLADGRMLIRPEYGEDEGLRLLRRAVAQGSVRSALMLAKAHRTGALTAPIDPRLALDYAYRAMELAVQADPTTQDGNPFNELAAGHLIVEMAKNGEAVDGNGEPLLTAAEIDRLERYYGRVNPKSGKVDVLSLRAPLRCSETGYLSRVIWVWDWGRKEAPTGPQIRNLGRVSGCMHNDDLQAELQEIFAKASASGVSFIDLLQNEIRQAVTPATRPRR